MTEAPHPADQESKEKEWTLLNMTLLDRLPLPFAAVLGGVFLLGIASIGLEILLKQRMAVWGPQDRSELIEAVATLVVVLYILILMRLIKQTTIRGLVQLRPTVKIDDTAYEQHVARMMCDRVVVELIIVALAAGLVVLFFVVPASGVRRLLQQGPADILAAGVMLLYYLIAFTAVLSVVYTSIRNAVALGALSRRPLQVNVFDPTPLLPFGRISLVQSLAFVGIFLIPLIIVGPPRAGGGWLVLSLSSFGLMALFAPLWGVHRQIVRERERVLGNISNDLLQVQQALTKAPPTEVEQLKALADRTDLLISFQKHILAAPSLPFRDFGAVIRASIAAASPLIYLVLNQLVQTYIFPMFTP
ncbi:MAG: hypothetical protein ACK4SA_06400 [Caldilinea sp.]